MSNKNESLIESIKNITAVYNTLNKRMPILADYSFLDNTDDETISDQEYALANQYLTDITKLFNGNWIPDFNSPSQRKYYNWYIKNSLGWVFSYCSYQDSYSGMGAGFYFSNREDCEYCAKQFIDIYKIILNYRQLW